MKGNGSREPLTFLLFSTSLLSNGKPAAFACSGFFYVIHYVLSVYLESIFDLHNHFQTIGQLAAFQFIPVNNGNSKLRGTVPSCGVTPPG